MVVMVRVDTCFVYTRIYGLIAKTGFYRPLKNKTVNLHSTSFHKTACCRLRGTNNFPADSENATSLPAYTKHK